MFLEICYFKRLVEEGFRLSQELDQDRLSLWSQSWSLTRGGGGSDHVMFWSTLTALLPDMMSCAVLRERVLWLMFTSRDNLCVAEQNLNINFSCIFTINDQTHLEWWNKLRPSESSDLLFGEMIGLVQGVVCSCSTYKTSLSPSSGGENCHI